MMWSALSLATLALALVAATGCRTFVPFTQELRDQNHLTDAELENLQYYVSSTITLRREVDSSGRQVTGKHKLLVVAGKTIEEVVVEDRTPGICVAVGPHALAISFEQGSSIEFAPLAARAYAPESRGFATPPALDPFPGNRARAVDALPADLFSGGYLVRVTPESRVAFLGRTWDALDDTAQATLLIDGESLDQVVKRRTVLPGLRLTSR